MAPFALHVGGNSPLVAAGDDPRSGNQRRLAELPLCVRSVCNGRSVVVCLSPSHSRAQQSGAIAPETWCTRDQSLSESGAHWAHSHPARRDLPSALLNRPSNEEPVADYLGRARFCP